MAQRSTQLSSPIEVPNAKTAIIQGSWHSDITDSMVKKCTSLLLGAGAAQPEHHLLPGSLELPLAAQRLARRDRSLEAIIAFGIILKGETDHYEVVRDECMRALVEVMLREDIPIIIEVLPVHTIDHAKARAGDNEFNKGIEAGQAALEVIQWRRLHALKGEPR